MSGYQDGVSGSIPPDAVNFLEFVAFPEERRIPKEWLEEQEELLATDPSSITQRALTVMPR
ncbi:hypothetical protein ACMG4H_13190 [Corynebacterium glutamicum]|uniref:Uncharacterized protein n=2 Tax=Corynebacterium glutamicum TaxID=1718 RepID=A0AB36ID47_CORGT|nr:hypothetical protein [Corynebacterium glutamicum]AGN18773.1 hypothetical protein C624_05960 [Corynebacterium glutamicum SCgG1]AGN21796.1 hypothetical protein C629_05960 [Corynebacterium glutamicum SCgG2]EGV40126.1 hypothetical protein CgS9114_09943 [Corynebacterium glutamicum S9114]EOA65096.1 hypothetical protein J433_05640 [Corynebacterium glutamicum MT]EPP41126.1 hypothetical protein A583_05482 [Corynebacterium glutamicum Z188]